MKPLRTGVATTLFTLLALAGLAAGGACAREPEGSSNTQPAGDTTKPKTHNELLGKPDVVAENADRDLKSSRVVGLLESPHEAGKSLVWCSTMQYAWNSLTQGFGPPITVAPPGAAAGYQASSVSTNDLDAGSYVALGGFGRDGILDAIRKELAAKFGGAASPSLLPIAVAPDDLLAYAYLFKSLEFTDPFARVPNTFKFGDTSVKAFGLWNSDLIQSWSAIAAQIDVRHYASQAEWTVRLKTKDPTDVLVVARRAPGATLAETVAAVVASMSPGTESLGFKHDDTLKVPLMNFDVTRDFTELKGLAISGSKGSGVITSAKQNIRLRLDEKGAILKSEAAIQTTSAMIPREQPKYMVCDGPFIVLMMREGAEHPYFAAWIESPELLVAER